MKRAFFLLILIACSSVPHVSFDSGVSFDVEIADSMDERARGLMFREHLDDTAGMLFVFDDETPRSFWMKNTLIPLDMIFINSNLTVVEVKANVLPCESDPCQSYRSLPSMYVLEINANLAENKGIRVGSKLDLRE